MKILTVKQQENGYLVNNTISVMVVDGSYEYELIKQWIAEGNVPEPEFTEEELTKQRLDEEIAEADRYLRKTDHKFYNGYKPKEGEDLVEIERLRDEAREFIRAKEV